MGLFGNGDNSFNPNPLFIIDPSGYSSESIYVADFHGDNKPDIVSAMQSSTKPGELEVLLNSSNPKTPTVNVASSLNPSTYGETVTFTATVTPNPLNWPTESVTFYSGTTKFAKAQLVNGTASISMAKLGYVRLPGSAFCSKSNLKRTSSPISQKDQPQHIPRRPGRRYLVGRNTRVPVATREVQDQVRRFCYLSSTRCSRASALR